jgi:hypothetical protein
LTLRIKFAHSFDAEDVIVNGVVLLTFGDDSGRCQLRDAQLVPHALEQVDDEDVFQVRMTLATDCAGLPTSAPVRGFVSVAGGRAIAVIVLHTEAD